MSDQYTTSQFKAFHQGVSNAAATAPILDQARPRAFITPAPHIERQLRSITDNILQAWPHEQPEFEMYLTSWRYYTPFTTLDGHLLVPIGFLQRSGSDDEIAFLLAHEISHVLLGHSIKIADKEDQKKMLRAFRKAGDETAVLAQVVMVESGDSPASTTGDVADVRLRMFQYYERLRSLTTEFIHPAWQKKQEDQADLLALELLLSAGYSPDGVADALRNLQTAEESFCEAVTEFADELDAFIKNDVAAQVKDSFLAGDADVLNIALEETRNFSEKKISKLIVKQALPKTHRTYEKRREYIWKFADKPAMELIMEQAEDRDLTTDVIGAIKSSEEFSKLVNSSAAIAETESQLAAGDTSAAANAMSRVFMESQQGRILKYRYKVALGEPEAAVRNIEIAMQSEYPSLTAFEKQLTHLLGEGDFESATAEIGVAEDLYGDTVHFLPEQIYMSARRPAGQSEDGQGTERLLRQCTNSNRENIEGPCYAAAMGTSPRFRERYREILATTDCALLEETGGDVVCTRPEKSKFLTSVRELISGDKPPDE